MLKSFPTSPQGAFAQASQMADRLKIPLREFCDMADVTASAVYRWRTNKRTYDVSLYGKLVETFEAKRRRHKR